jgi:hypothetical protein
MSLPVRNPLSRWIIPIIIGILVLSACAGAAAPREEPAFDQSMGAAPGAPPAPAEIAPESEGFTSQTVTNVTNQGAERIVIKNGNLSIVVADPPKSMDAISQMAQEMGGFVVSANLYRSS